MLKWTLLLSLTIATSGCVSTQGSRPVPDSSCAAFSIIRPSRQDTLDTKRQVLAHNTIYRKICGAK